MTAIIQIIMSTLTAVLSFSMIILLMLNGKKGDLKIKYVLFLSVTFIYCSGQVWETILNLNMPWLYEHHKMYLTYIMQYYKFIGVFFISPVWLMFCFSYSFKTLNSLEKALLNYIWIFFIPGIICYALLVTNSWSELIFYIRLVDGVWLVYFSTIFHIKLYIDLLYHLAGLILILKHIKRSYNYYKKQSLIIIASVFIPAFIGNIYFHTSLYQKLVNFDVTAAFLNITLLFFNLALLKYRFLNITPVAFPKMADTLNESILIVDAQGVINYYNRAFKENFSDSPSLEIDSEVQPFIGYIKEQVAIDSDSQELIRSMETCCDTETSGEIMLNHLEGQFTVHIQPLFVKKDYIGQIITFYNITNYKNLLSDVKNKNMELESANVQLREYASTVEELAVARERNRFAGDVHDSVGHTMTVLISLINVCSLAYEKQDMKTVKQRLDEMMKIALNGHHELKSSVHGIMLKSYGPNGIVQGIQSLVNDFKKTGVKVDFSVDGQESNSASALSRTVYRVCQEALTNSLRHGKATEVNILLRFTEQTIFLNIFDNGIGCKKIKKSMGLTRMEERVNEVGGKISFGSDGEKGFNICAELPA